MRVFGPVAFLLVSAACVSIGAPRPKDKEVRTPVDAPDGEWSVERTETNGKVVRSRKLNREAYTASFASDTWTLSIGGGPIGAVPAAFYQNGSVLEIDLSPDQPKDMKKGIWRVDGEILMVCIGAPGADRPTDFTAPKDSGRTLWTLKRK